MKLPLRDPGAGYLDSWLWMPKKYVALQQVAPSLTFQHAKGDVVGWRESRDHILVPRHFLLPETIGTLPYPVYDTRWTKFPKVSIQSRVVLDKFSNGLTYQRESTEALLRSHDGILCLRTGAGKTVTALHAASQLGVPILVVVKDAGLGEQWKEAILDATNVTEDEIGWIDGTHKLDWERKITIASVQTLARRVAENKLPPEIPRHFGVVLVDECHTMGAPYFNSAIPPFQGRRWGLSATPDREDGFSALLQYTLGEVIYTYLMPDVMPEVVFVQLPTRLDFSDKDVLRGTHVWMRNPDTGTTGPEFHHGKTYGYLATLEDRNARILRHVKAAVDSGRTVVVLSQSKLACKQLAEQYPGSGVVTGEIKGKERVRRIKECNPIFVIEKLGVEALDKPTLDTLFVVDPFKRTRQLQQGMGRILRSGTTSSRKRLVVFFEDVYIRRLSIMCGKVRKALNTWPAKKGGRIKYRIVAEKT